MRKRKPTPVIISNDQHEIKIYSSESHGRTLHQLSFYRGGKRERRSFADLNEAKREARIILGDLARESIEAENLTGAEIQSYIIARRTLAPFNIPVHVAVEEYTAARKDLPAAISIQDAVRYFNEFNKGIERKQINDLIEEYLSVRRARGVTDAYLAMLKRYVGGFGRYTAGRMLPDLRSRDLDDYLQKLPWHPVTKNEARQKIMSFCTWAKSRGFLPREWREFDGSMTFNLPAQSVSIFTPQEMERLLNASGRHLATPYIAIGAFAGLRSAEIKRLDWKNVNFERGFIEVSAEICKTRSRRLVPISDNLRAWLKPFAMPEGRIVLHHNIHEALYKIADRVGVEWKKNALRHSFVSYRLAATNDGAKTALEAGHDQSILFRHYREVTSPDMAAKWFDIMPPLEMQRGLVGMCRGNIGKHRDTPWQKPSAVYTIVPQRQLAA